jgi:hypothetical protein
VSDDPKNVSEANAWSGASTSIDVPVPPPPIPHLPPPAKSSSTLGLLLLFFAVVVAAGGYALLHRTQNTPPPATAVVTVPEAPAARPEVNPATPNTPRPDTQLEGYRQQARALLTAAQVENAFNEASAGLRAYPNDKDLTDTLSMILREAVAQMDRSRQAATSLGANARMPAYRNAEARRKEALRLQTAQQFGDAVREALAARDFFDTQRAMLAPAAGTGLRPAASPAPSPSAPPLVATSPGTPTGKATSASTLEPVPSSAPPSVAVSPIVPPAATPATVTTTPPAVAPAPATTVLSAAPTAAPASAARPAPPRGPSDEELIQAVVRAYEQAYSNLDAAAVHRLFPSVNEAQLRTAFSQARSQTAAIVNPKVAITESTAVVDGTWNVELQGQVGRTAQRSSSPVRLRLQKVGANWIIVSRQ